MNQFYHFMSIYTHWRCNLQQTKSYLPPLPSLFPPFEVTGSTLAKCVVTEALQVYCNSLSPSPKVIVYFRLIL